MDDPQSLKNAEDEAKNVLLNMATYSPLRRNPSLAKRSSQEAALFSPTLPSQRPSLSPTNIQINYQYGKQGQLIITSDRSNQILQRKRTVEESGKSESNGSRAFFLLTCRNNKTN